MEADITRKAVKNVQAKVEKATLGDLGILADLKKKIEANLPEFLKTVALTCLLVNTARLL